jgi:large subunit ribosomal protein L6
MSRIGKKPILIPNEVEVKLEGNEVMVKGPKGEIRKEIHPEIKIEINNKEIRITPFKPSKKTNALWGLTRALVANMVKGVTEGFEKELQIEGIGYKARIENNKLILNIGFSHPVEVEIKEGIKFSINKNIIKIEGVDKELVGQLAAKIRALRPPEAYKGKGIRYVGETVKLKPGKKVVAAAGA